MTVAKAAKSPAAEKPEPETEGTESPGKEDGGADTAQEEAGLLTPKSSPALKTQKLKRLRKATAQVKKMKKIHLSCHIRLIPWRCLLQGTEGKNTTSKCRVPDVSDSHLVRGEKLMVRVTGSGDTGSQLPGKAQAWMTAFLHSFASTYGNLWVCNTQNFTVTRYLWTWELR